MHFFINSVVGTEFFFFLLGMKNLRPHFHFEIWVCFKIWSFVCLLQDPVVRPISELGPIALQELLPEIPLWVKTPDYERVSFFLYVLSFLMMLLCLINCMVLSSGWLDEQVFIGYVALLRKGISVIHEGEFILLLDDSWLVFDFVAQAICGMIRTTAQPIFAEYIGKYQIKAIEFDKLSLGTLPPTICGKFCPEDKNGLPCNLKFHWPRRILN